jgi:hypothetical protein
VPNKIIRYNFSSSYICQHFNISIGIFNVSVGYRVAQIHNTNHCNSIVVVVYQIILQSKVLKRDKMHRMLEI